MKASRPVIALSLLSISALPPGAGKATIVVPPRDSIQSGSLGIAGGRLQSVPVSYPQHAHTFAIVWRTASCLVGFTWHGASWGVVFR